MRFDTLLCPVSLSPASGHVLRSAAYLAHRYGARLQLLHVVDPHLASALDSGSGYDETERKGAVRRSAKFFFLEQVQQPLRAGVEWDIVVTEGNIGERIAEAAGDPRVDLIVMGFRRARQPWATHWLDRVLRQVLKPVLAIPPEPAPTMDAHWRHIVLATDLTSGSEVTRETGRALAQMSGAGLTAAFVLEGLPAGIMPPEVAPAPEYRDFTLREAAEKLDRAFGFSWPEAAKTMLLDGDVGQEIARVAREQGADLIVVGYQSGRLHLLGSTADRLLEQSVCAVLVVPHKVPAQQAQAA